MQQYEKLEYGKFYHIYNHAVGGRNIFHGSSNYEYFLSLYDKHITPVAETYAWVLMKNHFHLLVKIRDLNQTGFENLSGLNPKPLHQHFSNLFNAYTKAYNKYYETRGALFERPFKRKLIDNNGYLQQVVLYIHNNPVHHGFCKHPEDYPWSSYLTCTSDKITKLKREEVMKWFNNKSNFKTKHGKTNIDMDKMDDDMGI